MDVVIGLVLVSLVLVALGLVFFFSRLREGDFDHGERLSLLPLREDRLQGAASAAAAPDATPEMTIETANATDPEHDREGGFSNGSG